MSGRPCVRMHTPNPAALLPFFPRHNLTGPSSSHVLSSAVQAAQQRQDELSGQLVPIAEFGDDLTRLRTQASWGRV